jgi:hypothetical protein
MLKAIAYPNFISIEGESNFLVVMIAVIVLYR